MTFNFLYKLLPRKRREAKSSYWCFWLNIVAVIALGIQVTDDQEMRSRTNVHYLVFHLTLADTITSYVTLPMETLWRQGQRRYSSRIYVTFPKIYLWTFSKREIMARKVKLSKSIFWFRLNFHFIFTKNLFFQHFGQKRLFFVLSPLLEDYLPMSWGWPYSGTPGTSCASCWWCSGPGATSSPPSSWSSSASIGQ